VQLLKKRPVGFLENHSQAYHAYPETMLRQVRGKSHADMIDGSWKSPKHN
jgi:hypothetical protein